MEEFKSNSNKARAREKETREPKKKVVTGKVKVKKQSNGSKFRDIFIPGDVDNVKSYIFMDVLVPAFKKAVSDIVTNGIDMILYGEIRGSKSTPASRVSYNKYSDRHTREVESRRYESRNRRCEDVIFDSRGDAEDVLDVMEEVLYQYGSVSVADFYDCTGLDSQFTDTKYGWEDLRSASVERDRSGGYYINLPRAKVIA